MVTVGGMGDATESGLGTESKDEAEDGAAALLAAAEAEADAADGRGANGNGSGQTVAQEARMLRKLFLQLREGWCATLESIADKGRLSQCVVVVNLSALHTANHAFMYICIQSIMFGCLQTHSKHIARSNLLNSPPL